LFPGSLVFVAVILINEARRRTILRQLRTVVGKLSESEARFRNVFDGAAVGIIIVDQGGSIVSVNGAAAAMSRFSVEELIGMPFLLPVDDAHRRESEAEFAKILEGDFTCCRTERRILRKDGTCAWLRTSISRAKTGPRATQETACSGADDARDNEVIFLCEDITTQKLGAELLNYQATHDSLTGLANRRFSEAVLERSVCSAFLNGTELNILYLDLDGFKVVNDSLGHATGDLLLRAVAARLKACLGEGDFLARVGGDEFIIIQECAPGLEPAGAIVLAAGILKSLNSPFHVRGQDIRIGVSIGISRYPIDGTDVSSLLHGADTAMYIAKQNEGRGFYFFDAAMRERARRKRVMGIRLRRALACGELYVHFQPVYQVATGRLVRFEALCRWNSDEIGEVPPEEFIPVAEEIGIIGELGRWILERSCLEALRWQNVGRPDIQVAVNVSAIQFGETDFPAIVGDILAKTSLPARLLELELTESTLIRDRQMSISSMQRLRAMGISLSIDDFGAGYSSLSYLQTLPIDGLKIDRSFTAGLGSSAAAASMIRSIIAMGRALGMRVVTEGIETSEQMELVRQLGSHEIQGYFPGKPEDGEAALRRVQLESSSLGESRWERGDSALATRRDLANLRNTLEVLQGVSPGLKASG
jgi:diguanylate cyclase (GGDEF)-like protein/PAS domain S-box-containing protein